MQHEDVEGYRLSSQQRRQWMLEREHSTLCVQGELLFEGALDKDQLRASVNSTIAKYGILRTTFLRPPGYTFPVQVIAQDPTISWTEYDLRHESPPEQDHLVENLRQQEQRTVFDLAQGPLVRVMLLTCQGDRHLLFLTLPGICADGPTLAELVREIARLYANPSIGSIEANDIIQYVQYAEWQNELHEASNVDAGRTFWKTNYRPSSSSPSLLFEGSVPVQADARSPEVLTVVVDPVVSAHLEDRAQQVGAPTSAFLLACWYMLLWRLARQQEIIVGSACDGRTHPELAHLVGSCTRYLPISLTLSEVMSLRDVLSQVVEHKHLHTTWQDNFTDESSTGSTSPRQLFTAGFDFETLPRKIDLKGLMLSVQSWHIDIDRFKLRLSCVQREEGLTLALYFDPQYFSKESIQCLANQFQALLKTATSSDASLELSLASCLQPGDDEQTYLIDTFNATKVEYPKYGSVHELFEIHAAKNPNSVAVVFEGHQLTYGELNERANQLAHHLQQLGVYPEKAVALFLDRSLDMIVGVLGILKVGAAYVPLDPSWPQKRLAFILEDTRASALITSQRLSARLADFVIQRIVYDSEQDQIAHLNNESCNIEIVPENLAYILYTSGSTGQPKGVQVEHRQLVNYVQAILDQLNLPAGAGFATVSTIAADLGNTVIFGALCSGGCLHIISQERLIDPNSLAEYTQTHPIDCLKITPHHLSALLASTQGKFLLPRQRLILGGESLSWDLVDEAHKLAPHCVILNHYGPTEATVGSLTHQIDPLAARYGPVVPLGQPIANTRVYVLDADLQPVPIGVPGEIYIGGTGIARGYINHPELTAERFIPDLLSGEAGARLYKTGDLARHLPNGAIEFLGRTDDQVKVHGFRVELAEIEQALLHHPAIREAVVMAQEEPPDIKRLGAYLVLNKQIKNIGEIQHFLREYLPDYMVPSVLVVLDALPLTSNGKVDRRALPPLKQEASPKMPRPSIRPRSPNEKILSDLYTQLLRVEEASIYDNFFELGGDSILGIQLVARANQLGLHITPKQLFEHQTIAELASVAEPITQTKAFQGVVTGHVPLTPLQHRLFEQEVIEPPHYCDTILLEASSSLDAELLRSAFKCVIEHHDALRLRFQQTPDGWEQTNADLMEDVPFTHLDLSGFSPADQSNEVKRIISNQLAHLRLASGPLISVALLSMGEDQPCQLILTWHYLVADAFSIRLMLEDIETVYQQLQRGGTPQLPPKTTSFKEWAEKLVSYVQSEEVKRELSYWLRLSDPPKPCLLVGDVIDKSLPSIDVEASTLEVELSSSETQDLVQKTPAAYQTTIDEVLLTALAQTTTQWTDASAMLIDIENHGREESITDVAPFRTVGRFSSRFPVRLDIGGADDIGRVLKVTKERLRQVPKRGLGYGLLRFCCEDKEIAQQLGAQSLPLFYFNNLGSLDNALFGSRLFKSIRSIGDTGGFPTTSPYALRLVAMIHNGHLRLRWHYSLQHYSPAMVEAVAEKYLEALRLIITHCLSSDAGGLTPSDFPSMQFSQEELDRIIEKVAYYQGDLS